MGVNSRRRRRTAALLAVLVAATGLVGAAALTRRHGPKFDLTAAKLNSLSPRMRAALERIPAGAEPVEILAVVGGELPERSAAQQAIEPFRQRLAASTSRAELHYVDSLRDPGVVRALDLQFLPAVVVRWQAPGEEQLRTRIAEGLHEDDLARALSEVIDGGLPAAYLLSGHGEASDFDPGTEGFAAASMLLVREGFQVKHLLLGGAGSVPEDAALLVVAGPEVDLVPGEVQALRDHAERGGGLLVALGPGPGGIAAGSDQAGWRSWLQDDWGLELDDSILADLDALSSGDLSTTALSADPAGPHAITAVRAGVVVAPLSRPARALDLPAVRATPLLRSGNHSWAESDEGQAPAFDSEADAPGPHVVAWALSRGKDGAGARLVFLGSSTALTTYHLAQAGNGTFLARSARWAAGLPPLPPPGRRTGDGTVVLTAPQVRQLKAVAATLPALSLLAAGLAWWRRRRG